MSTTTTTKPHLTMRECPRYLNCSAPICPLDPDWPKRSLLGGERVCIWLTELQKTSGIERVTEELGDESTQAIVRILPAIAESSCVIRHALDKATLTGSRLDAQRAAGFKGRASMSGA